MSSVTEPAQYNPVYPDEVSGPVLQVVGPNWMNRGDQLMLHAIDERLGARYRLTTPMMLRVPLSQFWGPRNAWLMTRDSWRRYRHRQEHGRPSVVLDCSGYQYGDPWKKVLPMLKMRALFYKRFVGQGGRLIVLPQSMGPFEDPAVAKVARAVFSLASLVFVRDAASRAHLEGLGCIDPERLRMAPDFTNHVAAVEPADPSAWAKRVLIVPNRQVVERGGRFSATMYVTAMGQAASRLHKKGLEPVILLHDAQDRELGEAIAGQLQMTPKILDLPAREAKGVMRHSHGVVASRYHAIISAKSQGIPTIGTSWAHKYQELFADYGCSQMLVDDLATTTAWDRPLALLADRSKRDALAAELDAAAERQRQRTLAMWAELEACIDG